MNGLMEVRLLPCPIEIPHHIAWWGKGREDTRVDLLSSSPPFFLCWGPFGEISQHKAYSLRKRLVRVQSINVEPWILVASIQTISLSWLHRVAAHRGYTLIYCVSSQETDKGSVYKVVSLALFLWFPLLKQKGEKTAEGVQSIKQNSGFPIGQQRITSLIFSLRCSVFPLL